LHEDDAKEVEHEFKRHASMSNLNCVARLYGFEQHKNQLKAMVKQLAASVL
jgi:hypothetical protein